ncbi:MAG: hypothetical protein GKR87_13285 [Kiritimatiellae bacterium]|nr:hypothetical protein [Kiritimatiellia bacterium]
MRQKQSNDDDVGFFRLLVHGDLRISENLRLFVEGKSALATGRDLPGGRRALDEDSLALQQAFVDLRLSEHVTLRSGRQALQYGKQRLISPLDWSNTRRAWEGFKAIGTFPDRRVDIFATRFVPVDKHDFNEGETDVAFYGVYSVHVVSKQLALDLYWLAFEKEKAVWGGITDDEERYTVGLRAWSPKRIRHRL